MDLGEARRRVRESTYAGWRDPSRWDPPVIVRAEGTRFWDADGREYLDFASQLVTANLGHGNPAVVEAIVEQARRLPYVSPAFATEVRAELAAELDGVLPTGLRQYFFSPSGTEANEAAFKFARAATGRSRILGLDHSYHGATEGALAVSGDVRRASPAAAGSSSSVAACYCYRCPLQLEYPGCGVACADTAERAIRSTGDVAALVVEPVVGTNGVLVPVPEYLPRLRAITRRLGVLLIVDEVMTGWGRTGRWFAVDHWGVDPDILTTAKGITSGYAPLGLTATTSSVRHALSGRPLPVGHTYEAHPLTLAPAVATLREYRRLGLVERSADLGGYLLARLREIAPRHPSVGDVRGLGLLAAVELVRDRVRRTPLNTDAEKRAGSPLVAEAVAGAMMADGVYVLAWTSHLVLAPPLIVERSEIDRAVEVLDRALRVADDRLRPPTGSAA